MSHESKYLIWEEKKTPLTLTLTLVPTLTPKANTNPNPNPNFRRKTADWLKTWLMTHGLSLAS